ncbi:uncharacterized protein LOC131545972 [Onychostoma macrolepis]|uniref:Uncharacterized protein n=1 Tax=Onychostoma macrolepis TaxID=369639 RepID=A0A7J6CT28_9TELE|nr:uncharacterized protein LOC131545972 [Onychostoma macrolepis]KAF4109693.1 hypothetical protein G5714_008945 [Onychostoma macrolepis]
MQDKSLLKYTVVRQVACLDPTNMFSDPNLCQERMKRLVHRFLQAHQLPGGISAGDIIVQQFGNFLSLEAKSESLKTRLDVFQHGLLCQSYPELWTFCKKLLLLSHGQATVERGFSVNKEVEADNMQEDTVVAQRMMCDCFCLWGGSKSSSDKGDPGSCSFCKISVSATPGSGKEKAGEQCTKRKAEEDLLEQLKKRKMVLAEVANSLEKEADTLAEKAEGKSGTLMAQLITKSNILRK